MKHSYGPVGTYVAGVAKSYYFGVPKIEVHSTACPSYISKDDWENIQDGLYVYPSLNQAKLADVSSYFSGLMGFSDSYFDKFVLHTPSPTDLRGDQAKPEFASCFGIFNLGDEGFNSALYHWSQMEKIVETIPGLDLQEDLGYVCQFINLDTVNNWLATKNVISQAYNKFIQSRYIVDAYINWGADPKAVFSGFYLGSVMAYGNDQKGFQLDDERPLKLYICFEEGWSPETFAGVRTKVDFRHLLEDEGQHLALLTADNLLRTPWAVKGK